ncbi:hypothetical protein SLT36_16190 [Aminobacter sp. BA135]|uniref:hypothetical protein n=1 Tax=Aminobacter sp. BA135 TaxID=537596 RepID=UPI003D78ED27
MTKTLVVTALALLPTLASISSFAQAADAVPCEKMLSDVNAAMQTTKADDAGRAKAADLKGKGLERCKADDDAGADAFFEKALKVLGG